MKNETAGIREGIPWAFARLNLAKYNVLEKVGPFSDGGIQIKRPESARDSGRTIRKRSGALCFATIRLSSADQAPHADQ